MIAGWLIVATFFLGGMTEKGATAEHTTHCATLACVHRIENAAWHSPNLVRLRVFADGEYAKSGVSGMEIRPALVDGWYQ